MPSENKKYDNNGPLYEKRRRFYEHDAHLKKKAVAEGHSVKISGSEVILYRGVSSTNTVIKELASSGLADRSIVWSQYQSQGRGRMRRKWDNSKPGRGLLFSMLIREAGLEARYAPLYTLFTAAVLAEAVRAETGLQAGIKWPNDMVAGGRKLCGILSESSLYGNKINYLVIGIGLNVNQKAGDFPLEIRDTSTSLHRETGRYVSRVRLLKTFLRTWARQTERLQENGWPYILEIWKKYEITLGREIKVISEERQLTGRAVDIGATGELILETPDGNHIKCLAEDISLGKYYYGKGG
ncbi:MAG: biotin--[acetyl-CoA-carboxylase] ligase [Syntrophomonadaceae bacterium]|nr:biotin--[acetyl-CoA-carboxylase] ligase [Syntrophomonadaceae bacterium]